MSVRVTLLAPAGTAAQRRTCFPRADDEVEALAPVRAEALGAALGRADRAVGGPERRVAQTAAALGLAIEPDGRLAAWSAGEWAGRSVTEIADAEPERFAAWRTDPDAGAPGGESLRVFLARCVGWLGTPDGDGATVVVADASVVRAVVVGVLGALPEAFWRLDVGPLSTTVVQGDGSAWRVRSLGNAPSA
jgi:broad specificity phosphatase PhoE